jgi:hypothetical protein
MQKLARQPCGQRKNVFILQLRFIQHP